MNPKIFGWQHFTYLAVCIVLAVVSLILIKIYVKSEKGKFITIKVVAGLLLASILWNRITLAVTGKNWTNIIPNTFCGMSSLVLALACLIGKKNNNVLHFVFYLAVVGDFVTLIYPDFIGQSTSIFYSKTISGLLHHTIGLYLCVLLVMLGRFTPNYKKWTNLVIGFMAYITLGAFMMSVFDYDNAFYITKPILSGTPLTVWVLAPIFAALYISFFIIYELVKKKLVKKKAAAATIEDENSQSAINIENKNNEK